MSCDWAEKVSALMDGELAAGEARAVAEHAKLCAECGAAEHGFQSLRRELSSYSPSADPSAQSRVLAAVLASKSAGREMEERERRGGGRRESAGVRGLVAGLFGGRAFAPAMSAAAALLIVAALGLLVYLNSRRDTTNVNVAVREDAPAARQGGGDTAGVRRIDPQPEARPTPEEEKRREVVAGGVTERAEPRREVTVGRKTRRVVGAREPRRRVPDASAPGEVAERAGTEEGGDRRGVRPSDTDSTSVVAVASSSTPAATEPRRDAARADVLDTARHAEQAQMLLRSFRNARLADGGLAYERARSKKLLYRNIVLRREATTKRDAAVAQALDRLEPILLDIANLPDNPASADVDSIRERVRKKNLVVALQAGVVKYK